jgi:hypothetical protein
MNFTSSSNNCIVNVDTSTKGLYNRTMGCINATESTIFDFGVNYPLRESILIANGLALNIVYMGDSSIAGHFKRQGSNYYPITLYIGNSTRMCESVKFDDTIKVIYFDEDYDQLNKNVELPKTIKTGIIKRLINPVFCFHCKTMENSVLINKLFYCFTCQQNYHYKCRDRNNNKWCPESRKKYRCDQCFNKKYNKTL